MDKDAPENCPQESDTIEHFPGIRELFGEALLAREHGCHDNHVTAIASPEEKNIAEFCVKP